MDHEPGGGAGNGAPPDLLRAGGVDAETAQARLAFLAAAGTMLGASLDYETTLQSLARLAVPALADWCVVDLVQDDGSLRRLAVAHVDPAREALLWELARRYPPDPNQMSRPIGKVLGSGKPVLVAETPAAWLTAVAVDPGHRELLELAGIRSTMSAPLIARGRTLGVISLTSGDSGRIYSEVDLALLEELARRAGLAIDNARLYREARQSEQEARVLYEAALAVGGELELEARLGRVLDAALSLLNASRARVALVNPAGTEIDLVATRGLVLESLPQRQPLGVGLTGMVIAQNRPLRAGDVQTDPRAIHGRVARASGIHSWLGVPLSDRGNAFGAIFVLSEHPHYFTDRHERLLGSLAALTGAAVREARLYQQLQDVIHARDVFISSAAHDLKNPLAALQGITQLLHRRALRSQVPETRQMADGLARVESTSIKMNRMLQELLDATRLEVGRPLELDRRPTDLVALARQVAAEQQRTTSRQIIRVESGEAELLGEWDAARLERVLTNLLGNAVKYSPEQGGVIVVRLDRAPDDGGAGWAIAQVRDQGLGIPAADMPHVFERFWRGRNVLGRIAGTGIGLAGARQIVEQHGGTIFVESVEGAGSTFTVRLPMSDTSLAALEADALDL